MEDSGRADSGGRRVDGEWMVDGGGWWGCVGLSASRVLVLHRQYDIHNNISHTTSLLSAHTLSVAS